MALNVCDIPLWALLCKAAKMMVKTCAVSNMIVNQRRRLRRTLYTTIRKWTAASVVTSCWLYLLCAARCRHIQHPYHDSFFLTFFLVIRFASLLSNPSNVAAVASHRFFKKRLKTRALLSRRCPPCQAPEPTPTQGMTRKKKSNETTKDIHTMK